VLPVGPDQDLAAGDLRDELVASGLRVRLEAEGSLGARIRAGRTRRDAVLAVLGPAEVDAGAVQVTDVAAGFRGAVPRRRLVEALASAYADRARTVAWGG
jgi:threonyl-tRNA synthetase